MTEVNNNIRLNLDYLQSAMNTMPLSNNSFSTPVFTGSNTPAAFDSFGGVSGLGNMTFPMPTLQMPSFQMPTFQLPDFSQLFANACSQMNSYMAMRTDFLTALLKNPPVGLGQYDINTNSNLPVLEDVGYNSSLGKKLAQSAVAAAGPRSSKECAKHVSDAMASCGVLGERGHAYQLEYTLRKNNNFKEIKITSADELKNLPAGCVVVYPRGAAGYSSEYGHVEIAMGNGSGVSDFVNKNMKYSPDVKVFVPVAA